MNFLFTFSVFLSTAPPLHYMNSIHLLASFLCSIGHSLMHTLFHSLLSRDTIIYSATCPRLGGRIAAVKVYDRAKVAPTKLRAIKREIAMMMFFHRKK